MLFNSYIFIFCFLPICILGYFLLNKTKKYQLGHGFLLGMSLWFYGYFNPGYLLIIIASVAVNYLIYKWMKRLQQKALLEASTVNPELDILPISSVGKLKKCKPTWAISSSKT